MFVEFGNFLENYRDNNSIAWIRTLKFNEYLENEINIDNLLKEKYVKFLEMKGYSTFEIHTFVTVVEFNFLNEISTYKFYFIKYCMWNLIPSYFEKLKIEKIEKFEEIPENIKKIPGVRTANNVLVTIWQIIREASGGVYGK